VGRARVAAQSGPSRPNGGIGRGICGSQPSRHQRVYASAWLSHFDAHFENILCDGERLYFSDFGLALSAQFDLTSTELEFLVHHRTFDRGNSALSLVICLLGGAGWEVRLREYLQGGSERMPATIHRLVLRDAPVALALKEFFGQLHDNKGSVYPADSLAKLLVPASTRTAE
jgi:hypothetical protein